MALHILVRRNYGGKLPVSIKCPNLYSFKKGVILLCDSFMSVTETRTISHLFSSALFRVPLNFNLEVPMSCSENILCYYKEF